MAYTDLYLDQGTDFASALNLQADDGSPINLTNYIFTSQIRKSYYSANATANIAVTIIDAPNGLAELSMTAANTANIFPGRYVYDVLMMDSTNTFSRIVQGIMTVTPSVTRSANSVMP